MAGLHGAFKTNAEKEQNGVEIKIEEAMYEDGSFPTFLIARAGGANKNYLKTLEEVMKPYRRQMELKTMKNEVAEELMKDVFVRSLLVGWNNVRDENNEQIEFNKGNALTLLNDMPDLFSRLQGEANALANFQDAGKVEDAKN